MMNLLVGLLFLYAFCKAPEFKKSHHIQKPSKEHPLCLISNDTKRYTIGKSRNGHCLFPVDEEGVYVVKVFRGI